MNDASDLEKAVADIVKEFKANGNFDQFRKDCFAEISAQTSFDNLGKNADDIVQRILKEQSHSLRKNEMRDFIRRKLNDNYMLNNSINLLLNQIIDSKIESNFKPIVLEMARSLSTNQNDSTLDQHQHIKLEPGQTSNLKTQQTVTTKAQTVSVDDFLKLQNINTEKQQQKVVKTEKSKSSLNVNPTNSIKMSSNEQNLVKKEFHKNDLAGSSKNVDTSKKSSTTPIATAVPVKSKPSAIQLPKKKPISFEYLKSPRLLNDSPLELDPSPRNTFNYDWNVPSDLGNVGKDDDELSMTTTTSTASTSMTASFSSDSSANSSTDMRDSNETLE